MIVRVNRGGTISINSSKYPSNLRFNSQLVSFRVNLCKHNKQMDQFKGQPRLPKFVVPKRYDIRLKPDLVAHRFAGSVAVNLDIVAATSFIVLNAAELDVSNDAVSFTNQDSSKVLSTGC